MRRETVTCDRCGAEVPRGERNAATLRLADDRHTEVYDMVRLDLCPECAKRVSDEWHGMLEGDGTAGH